MRRLAAVLLLGLAACAGAPPGPSPAGSTATTVRIRAEAQALYERFAGTVADQDALDLLADYRNNGGTAECLAARGFPGWDWAALRLAHAPQDALAADPPWAAEPHRGRWSEAARAGASFRRAEIVANDPPDRPALDAAVGDCIGTRPARLAQARSHEPRVVRQLPDAWWRAVGAATAPYGSSQDYLDCMTGQHIPLLDGRPFSLDSRRLDRTLDDAFPPAPQIPVGQEPTTPAWTRYLALERQVTDADWACREPTYADAVSAVGPVVDAFGREHAAEIERAAAYWTQVRRRAAALGWDPETGEVDLTVVS